MIRWAALLLAATPALADDVEAFVEGNVLSIFYHELGHALIDIEGVPIFGQEEDAADVFSVVMTVALFDAATVEALAYDYALLFDADAQAAEGFETAWWDVHGPDEQRFYNTVCLFYGSDPEGLDDYAADMGLPEDRAISCEEEFEQAWSAWGGVLDQVTARGGGDTLTLETATGTIGSVLTEEVAALNAMLQLSAPLAIRVEPCGEENAFYDPGETAITFCSDYEDALRATGRDLYQ